MTVQSIVVVDDSQSDRAHIRSLLVDRAGTQVEIREADTGRRGIDCYLESAAGTRPECILLAARLPDMDAFEALKMLQSHDGSPLCAVIVMTRNIERESARAVVRAGAQDCVDKQSMTAESLTRAIDSAIERWHMTQELRVSAERLARAQRAAKIGTWDWDIVTGKASWTDEAWRLFGHTPRPVDVDYGIWLDSVHPDDREHAASTVVRALQCGSYIDEFRVLTRDGVVRWLEARGEVLYDATGRPLRLFGTVQDITERRHIAEDLLERESRLRLALRASATGVWSWEIETGRVTWSDEAYAIVGVTPSDSKTLAFADFERMLHPDDRARVLAGVGEAVKCGLEYHDEFRIMRPDGAVRRVVNLGVVQLDAAGHPRSMLGTITDVTNQREAQEALSARTLQFQAIADNTPDIIARFDREMRHLFVNKAVESATGMSASAFFGKSNRELGMAPELCQLWEDAIESVFVTGQPTSYEFQFDSPHGRHHYAARLVAERNLAGSIESVLCVSHDITALKHAERTMLEADQRKDMFLATLAHELRNPLAPLRTGLELIRLAGNRPVPAHTIAVMDRQIEHMARLIDDLMDVSRVATGKVILRRQTVCLQDILAQTVDTSRPLLERAKHVFRFIRPSGRLFVDGDAARLTQVVSNLLTNAAKYTPEGGKITLRLSADQTHAIFSVEDTGLGLPAESLSDIFDMFTQVNRTLDRSQGGLGIGLALVKYLVEAHDGAISAASAGIGQGSTFSVRLPLAQAAEAVSGKPAPTARVAPPSCRALIVDDNPDAAELLAQIVSKYGSEAQVAFSGTEALQLARTFKPTIIFLDITLPDMNGYTVAQRVREDPELAKTTLVAVTGWGSEEDRKKSARAGFDHHRTKPLSGNAIRELLLSAAAS